MKKILVTAIVFLLVSLVALAPAQAEKESKSTTPVVAAVPLDYYRQMEQEKVSRERVRAAVVKHQAKQAKIAKAKKVAAAKKRAKVLAERKRQARLAQIAAANREAARKAEAQRIARQTQRPKPIQKPSNTVNAPRKAYSGGSAKAYALSLVGAAQFACLEPLWEKESGWNPTIANASSGAYGIPQALPGSKMASAGADWATNPLTQVRWGVSYIQGRYGSPCAAWSHSQSVGWY